MWSICDLSPALSHFTVLPLLVSWAVSQRSPVQQLRGKSAPANFLCNSLSLWDVFQPAMMHQSCTEPVIHSLWQLWFHCWARLAVQCCLQAFLRNFKLCLNVDHITNGNIMIVKIRRQKLWYRSDYSRYIHKTKKDLILTGPQVEFYFKLIQFLVIL